MKWPRNFVIRATAVGVTLALMGCGSDLTSPRVTGPPVGGGTVPVASVVVTLTLAGSPVPLGGTLNVHATFQLTSSTRDTNGHVLTGRVVTWASSDTAVATVSAAGLLTCVAPGSATIIATSEGATGAAEIAVADLSWLED